MSILKVEQTMRREDVASKLRGIFATILDLPETAIVSNLAPDNCEKWDSLHHIHIISAISETFGISLEIEAQVEILTFDLGVIIVCEALEAEGRLAA